MLQEFQQFFTPSVDIFDELWKGALIVCDASVLLNIYGYSDKTREELLNVLEAFHERLRLPHQFGLEYARNRPKVILKQVGNYRKVEKILEDLKVVNFAPRHEHPFLSEASEKAFEAICQEMSGGRKKVENLLGEDPHAKRLFRLFDKMVGPAPSSEGLKELHDIAKARYAAACPPGYADLKEKGEPEAYGDYIGWKQAMDIAIKEKRGLILVTDDTKEDWWHYEKERLIGPRPELIAEFRNTTGVGFHMYTSPSFLRQATKVLGRPVSESAIEEVTERLASQVSSVGLKPAQEVKLSQPEGGEKPTEVNTSMSNDSDKPKESQSERS